MSFINPYARAEHDTHAYNATPAYTSSVRERVILLANQLVTANNEPARGADRNATLRTLVQMLRRLSAGAAISAGDEGMTPRMTPVPIHLSLRSANAGEQEHDEEEQRSHLGTFAAAAAAPKPAPIDYGLRPLRPPQPFTAQDLYASEYVSHNSDCKPPFSVCKGFHDGGGFVNLKERKRPVCDVAGPQLEANKARSTLGGHYEGNPGAAGLSAQAILSSVCVDQWAENVLDTAACSAIDKEAAVTEEEGDLAEPPVASKEAAGDWWCALEATLNANLKA